MSRCSRWECKKLQQGMPIDGFGIIAARLTPSTVPEGILRAWHSDGSWAAVSGRAMRRRPASTPATRRRSGGSPASWTRCPSIGPGSWRPSRTSSRARPRPTWTSATPSRARSSSSSPSTATCPEPQAILVAQIARNQSLLYSGTEDYLVTRQFRELASAEDRLALLRCCYLVGAADDTITAEESNTLQQIAKELDLDRDAVNTIRNEFAPKLAAIQRMLHLRGDAGEAG